MIYLFENQRHNTIFDPSQFEEELKQKNESPYKRYTKPISYGSLNALNKGVRAKFSSVYQKKVARIYFVL